ncbi:MAG: hypothetical protein C3F06_14800 [Candidatus Methanoperedenaceae archaeon]|nr:MAG: hypothetical protein C3F06_14800 [Candidatus Methanoperedenaceae archaeon]
MKRNRVEWQDEKTLDSTNYICGHCGIPVASQKGYYAVVNTLTGTYYEYIFICHYCKKPTYIDEQRNQIPGSIYGNEVSDLPTEIENLYNEARNCVSCKAYTASVLCSRKLLMNIAVLKGAKEGLKFFEYVNFLSDKNYTPPDGKDWVDHIRKKGNEAAHEIAIMNKEDAEELIDFIEMLLKFIYEFPATMKKKKGISV